MIQRLKLKQNLDVLEMISRVKDYYQDFYLTINKERIYINNLRLIEKLLKYQEVYGVYTTELKGIMVIYREKGFRPHVKFLTEKRDYTFDLLKHLNWNFSEELFAKVKVANPLSKILQMKGFIFKGNRGEEILLIKPKREIKKDGYHSNQTKRPDTR
jgi:hypothetical protein